MIDEYEHMETPADYYGEDYHDCERCGSDDTFDTFDGKRVCRECCHVEKIAPRPVNVITHQLKRSHERLYDAKMKVNMIPSKFDRSRTSSMFISFCFSKINVIV